jgi:WD40 repeat protein
MLLAGVLAVSLTAVALAERTRFWRQTSYDEFDKGTAKGVALRSDGRLVLAPRFTQFADPNAAYLWALRVDSKGRLYVAGGSNAKVFRLDDKGTTTAVFESQEMAAQALAFDAQDNLYVGTSPDGKVYKVTPDGKSSVFFEPKTKYIWDLALDSAGTLYVATGDKGEVFTVGKDGKGQIYYKSEETHVRALAFDSKGNLILGTDPNGLILRVQKSAEGTRGFVLFETAKREVTSLLAGRDGHLYASAIGDKGRGPGQQPVVVQPPQPTPQQQGLQPGVAGQVQPPVTTFAPFPTSTGGSDVLRITPDGAPEQLWSSRDEIVYALALSPKGRLLMGTGNKGLVLQLEENNVFSSLGKTASAQVTGLVQGPGGKVFAATSNPGKIFALGPDTEPEGTFESQTFDAKVFSQWGQLRWWGEDGAANGQVAFYMRTGNTSNPEKNWSPWCGPYSNSKGEAVSCPAARFAQWKAVFKTGSGGAPSIGWVSLAYLPKNVAPTIDSIVLQNPGVRIQSFSAPQGMQQQAVQLRLPPPSIGGPGGVPPQPQQPQRFDPPPQGFAQRGNQAVIWSARDDNDDDLTYSVYFRAEGEKNWRLLKDKLETKFYSWDTNTMPDGAYYLKVVASDAASNPPGEELAAERVSDRFEVDNTAPAVLNVRHAAANPEVRVQFTAKDSYSIITRAEYSVDSGEWKLVFPTDRTSDSAEESYEIVVRDLSPGEHTITVRVYDQFENSATEKLTFTLPAAKK